MSAPALAPAPAPAVVEAARDVAAVYAGTPSSDDPLVAAAYADLVAESDALFRRITAPDRPDRVRVEFTACPRPYDGADELIESVRDGGLLEVVTIAADRDRRHPLMGSEAGGAYDRFRAVHDVVGHAGLGRGFDRDGEMATWRYQDQLHGPLARRALATELHGQHSVLWTTGRFAEPKAILLDPRVLRRSVAASLTKTPQPCEQKGSS